MMRSRTPHAAPPSSALRDEVDLLRGVEAACGDACTQRHAGACLMCGERWESHTGHLCREGTRGAWPVATAAAAGADAAGGDVEGGSGSPPLLTRRQSRRGFLGKKQEWCNGSFLASQDSGVFILIAVIIVAPLCFFEYTMSTNLLAQIGALLLAFGSVASGSMAVLLDPGVVPPLYQPLPQQLAQGRRVGRVSLNDGDEVVLVDGQEVVRRWCTTCGMHRPLRAAHCPECDVCVEEFDHHCPVIGSCVGQRTFRFFAGFLWCTAVLTWWVCYWTVRDLMAKWPDYRRARQARGRHGNGGDMSAAQGGQIVLCVYVVFIGLCVSVFGMFYCTLTCSNQTERENLRDLYGSGSNPWDKGCLVNWCTRVLGTIPVSRVTREHLAAHSNDPDARSQDTELVEIRV